MTAVRVLETVDRTAPLGVRFWDLSRPGPIAGGLAVSAWREGRPRRVRQLAASHSGAYVLHNAPEFGVVSRGDGSDAFWAGIGAPMPFIVAASDPVGRFLPARLAAGLPHRRLLTSACLQSPADPLALIVHQLTAEGYVPLFSAPSRKPEGHHAVIRASLRRRVDDKPAAWAVLVAEAQGHVAGVGAADGRGELAMLFPFPEIERRPVLASPAATPPGGGSSGHLPNLASTVTLRVFHADALADMPDEIPDLCTMLGQPERSLLGRLAPSAPLGDLHLPLGQDLWLTTTDAQSLYVA